MHSLSELSDLISKLENFKTELNNNDQAYQIIAFSCWMHSIKKVLKKCSPLESPLLQHILGSCMVRTIVRL